MSTTTRMPIASDGSRGQNQKCSRQWPRAPRPAASMAARSGNLHSPARAGGRSRHGMTSASKPQALGPVPCITPSSKSPCSPQPSLKSRRVSQVRLQGTRADLSRGAWRVSYIVYGLCPTGNPIKQDTTDDGQGRYYRYGSPPFNYGLLPQTWEDPALVTDGYGGDNDPLDIMEVGSGPLPIGSVVKVRVRPCPQTLRTGRVRTGPERRSLL